MRSVPRLADPDLDFPYLLLLVSGGHCQLLEVRGVGDYRRLATTIDDAAGEAFDKAAKLLGLGLSRRPGDRGAGEGRRCRAPSRCRGRWSARASRISPSPGSRARCSAQSPRATFEREDIAASFQQAVVDCLVDRTRLALRASDAPALVVAGRSRRQPGDPQRACRARAAQRPALQRAARLALHRQCGDDRLGRRRALRRAARCDPLDVAGARALAARRARRKGARGGREGMKLGSHRRRRLGHRAGAGRLRGRPETLLWALEPEVVEAINDRHENPIFLPGVRAQSIDPGNRRSCRARSVRRLARRYARAAHARRPRAGAALAKAAGPLRQGNRGDAAESFCTRSRRRAVPARRSRCSPARHSPHEVAKGLPTAVTLAAEDRALARAAARPDRSARHSESMCPTTSPAPRSAAR